jgi:hypothetical protein
MGTDDLELDNLIKLARLAEHFMDVAADRLPDPETLDLKAQLELQPLNALSEQAGEEMFAMDDGYKALLSREPPVDHAVLTAAATRLVQMTIRAGEAFAMLAVRIVGDEKLPKLLDDEDHDQATSDAFLVHGDPLLAKAFAPLQPG